MKFKMPRGNFCEDYNRDFFRKKNWLQKIHNCGSSSVLKFSHWPQC